MRVEEIVRACGGRLLCGRGDAAVTSVETDSRAVRPGALFVPIRGERTDAHRFIPSVLEAGAAAVLTQEHDSADGAGAWIAVRDTREALRKIAGAYRAKFHIPVVGVTGSVGKTTTKEMIGLALSAGLRVMKTEGNFNSQIGVPLTVFRLSPEHQAAVVEMGMSDFGEMSRIAQVARPTCAVMTNIGMSHLENLKTRQNIRSEKLHITDCFTKDSVLFLNGDDPLLAELDHGHALPFCTVRFGMDPRCDWRAEDVKAEGDRTEFTACFSGRRLKLTLPVPGLHNVRNALAALAVAEHLGVGAEKAARALASYRSPAMRQQVIRSGGVTVLDDSYNASPDSVRSSIDVLHGLKKGGRAVCVFADMLELGELSAQAHFETGVYAAQSGVDALFTVGEQAKEIARGARSANPSLSVFSFLTNEEASQSLKAYLRPGDAVVVKGSRGMKTDEIVRSLTQG